MARKEFGRRNAKPTVSAQRNVQYASPSRGAGNFASSDLTFFERPPKLGGVQRLIVLLVLSSTGLAGLGVHRFYLGHTRAGLIFLALFLVGSTITAVNIAGGNDTLGQLFFGITVLVLGYGVLEGYFFTFKEIVYKLRNPSE